MVKLSKLVKPYFYFLPNFYGRHSILLTLLTFKAINIWSGGIVAITYKNIDIYSFKIAILRS